MPSEREVIRKVLRQMDNKTLAVLKNMECEESVPDTEPMKVLAADDPGGITGSKQVPATCCGRKVWISPSTQDMIARRGKHMVEVVCVQCLIVLMKEAKREKN